MRIVVPEKPHSWRDVIASVLAAAIGVQSGKNQQHDFEHGNPRKIIAAGITGVIIFICVVYFVVQLVIQTAGP